MAGKKKPPIAAQIEAANEERRLADEARAARDNADVEEQNAADAEAEAARRAERDARIAASDQPADAGPAPASPEESPGGAPGGAAPMEAPDASAPYVPPEGARAGVLTAVSEGGMTPPTAAKTRGYDASLETGLPPELDPSIKFRGDPGTAAPTRMVQLSAGGMLPLSSTTTEAGVLPRTPEEEAGILGGAQRGAQAQADAIAQQARIAGAEGRAEGAAAVETADVEEAARKRQEASYRRFAHEMAQHEADDARMAADVDRTKINPERYFQNRSTWERISGVLAAAFFGLAGGNALEAYMGRIDQRVKEDIAAQESELGKKQEARKANRSMMYMLRQMYGDEQTARAAGQLMQMRAIKARLEGEMGKYKGSKAEANGLALLGALQQETVKLQVTLMEKLRGSTAQQDVLHRVEPKFAAIATGPAGATMPVTREQYAKMTAAQRAELDKKIGTVAQYYFGKDMGVDDETLGELVAAMPAEGGVRDAVSRYIALGDFSRAGKVMSSFIEEHPGQAQRVQSAFQMYLAHGGKAIPEGEKQIYSVPFGVGSAEALSRGVELLTRRVNANQAALEGIDVPAARTFRGRQYNSQFARGGLPADAPAGSLPVSGMLGKGAGGAQRTPEP